MKKGVNSEDKWIKYYIDIYLIVEKKFLRKDIGDIYIKYSQSVRGPEIGSIKISNSIYSVRNINVINGRLYILIIYNKARKRRGNTEYIIRFLSNKLNQIFIQYIIYI